MVRSVWAGWLGLACMLAVPVRAQSASPAPPIAALLENRPNPVHASTTIPFEIFPAACADGEQPRVSLRIYNVLAQLVAVPVLDTDRSVRLDGIRLPCRAHEAFWEVRPGGQTSVAPGVYYYQLSVDGVRFTRKLIVRDRVASR